ncbi:MAG: beta strand repeat-containing protein [Janthinobacterium lividum]
MSGTSQTAYAAANLASSLGVNIDPTVAAATTLADLKAVGITNVRVVDDGTAATQATLKALAAGGIKIDLVLGQTEQADTLIADAKALDAATANSVLSLEGPQVVGHPNYTYTPDADAITGGGKTYTGAAAGDQAAYDVFNDAHLLAANAVLASTPVITYSLTTAAGAVFGEPATLGNISLGNGPNTSVSEPAMMAFNAAQSAAAGGAVSNGVASNGTVSGKVITPQSTYVRTIAQGPVGVTNYAVTELGAANGAQLANLVFDANYVYTNNGRTPVAGAVTYVDSLTPDTVASGIAPVSLFNGKTSGSALTVAGTEIASLTSILATGANSTAAATLTLTVPAYQAGVQAADEVAVFKGPGASDNIVWWGDEEAAKVTGHGAATLGFSQVEGTVTVFDPTVGTAAVATLSNVSSLSIGNFGDGPLVVQVSNTLGTLAAGASAVGTYAGVSATATGVTTTVGASGSTTFTTQSGGQNTVTTTASGADVVISQGNDTINAGGGVPVTVFASGASATVMGGAGNLTFIAGGGNYAAGGGAGVDILYGGSGSDTLIGGGGANSILVSGTGNETLQGGAGSAAIMFGGTASTTFIGSTGGGDQMIGGAGPNTYVMTNNDVAFGGPTGPDVFSTGTGNALLVEGVGPTQINLGGGNTTAFAGTGVDTYAVTKGLGGVDNIIGFKAGDHITLGGGFTATDASNAVSQAATGSFGTSLNLSDGTQVNLFGVSLTASQVTSV